MSPLLDIIPEKTSSKSLKSSLSGTKNLNPPETAWFITDLAIRYYIRHKSYFWFAKCTKCYRRTAVVPGREDSHLTSLWTNTTFFIGVFSASSDWSHGLFLYLPVSLEKCSISLAAEDPTVMVWMTDPPLITSEKHLPVLLSCPPVTSIISDPYRCPSFFLMTWW